MIYEIRHLRRSGSHGIINWMIGHFKNVDVFMNINNGFMTLQGKPFAVEIHGDKHDNMIYSYENLDPVDRLSNLNIKKLEEKYNYKNNYGEKFSKTILIIRSPHNWAASHIHARTIEGSNDYTEIDIDLYYKYLSLNKNNNFYTIYFDFWFSDPEYRRKIENDLDLEKSEQYLEKVSNYGNGSSFDGTTYNGKAQEMDVLNRWKMYENHHIIQKIISEYGKYSDFKI